jgi:RNA recognition motif-containing protein
MAQKLFIGGLAFTTSTERLREVFAAVGQVESAAVVTDRDTGRSRGFGFVEMATSDEADKAITQFNGKDVDGRQIRVEKASPGGGARGSGGGGGNSRGFGGSSRGGRW